VLVVKNATAIAELAPAPVAATIPPPATPPHTTTTTTTATKRAPSQEEVSHAPKRRKFKLSTDSSDTSSWAGPPKRWVSEFSEASLGGAMKKRTKKDHKWCVQIPALAGRKRGAEDDFVQWREDVHMKKGRPGYFQDGDPPMEYEDFSSDDEGEDQPGYDPVVLSSDEGEDWEL
jgi:hypothetical protein